MGDVQGLSAQGFNCHRRKMSGCNYLGAVFLGGNCLGCNCLGGNCLEGLIVQGEIVLFSLARDIIYGWPLSNF